MKPTKEQVEAYKSMAKQSPQTMEGIIKSHLEQNCQKYAGNEDKFDRCISHLRDTVLNGETADLVRGALGSFNYRKLEEAIAARKEEDRIFNEIMDSELATRKT